MNLKDLIHDERVHWCVLFLLVLPRFFGIGD